MSEFRSKLYYNMFFKLIYKRVHAEEHRKTTTNMAVDISGTYTKNVIFVELYFVGPNGVQMLSL